MMEYVKRPKIVAANWKMNGSHELCASIIDQLLLTSGSFTEMDVVLCPPFVYLHEVHQKLRESAYKLGAQNLYYESAGAFTGEISADMLRDMGCQFVIIGHSERRQLFQENDELIARKFLSAYHAGIVPILCLGETEAQRKQGVTFPTVEQQLKAVLDKVPVQAFEKAVIAYEPVWAIGTGLTASPEQAEEVHKFLREKLHAINPAIALRLPIIYGGSVKAENASDLFKQANIDGALVGGASLKAAEFLSICRSALATT